MEFLRAHATIILIILLGAAVALGGVLTVRLGDAGTREAKLREQLTDAGTALNEQNVRIGKLESLLTETKTLLESTVAERDDLSSDLDAEKERNDEFEDQIRKIGSKVGTLDKLAKTDKELLMKYSKVYFLNEHYMPAKLTELPKRYVSREDGDPEFIHAEVYPFLKDMLDDAADDGVTLKVLSAFRSFDEQRALKGTYTVTYGTGANTFSADQGYSEHQLGTTVDFTTDNLGGSLTGFETTPAYTWLLEHAYRYGFVLSYPKDNAYYIFEPWHWRFVGTDLARDLHNDGAYFYDKDQREIDAYLVSLFD